MYDLGRMDDLKNFHFLHRGDKDLREKESVFKEVSQMFSSTGAPAYVMDTIVDTFNSAVNEHIALIWPSAHYELKSHKEKKTGDAVAKFSDNLIING